MDITRLRGIGVSPGIAMGEALLPKRVAGIEDVTARPCDRWVRGMLLSGREVRVKVRRDHFGGPGDLYLFGSVLDRFLAQCAQPSQNARAVPASAPPHAD